MDYSRNKHKKGPRPNGAVPRFEKKDKPKKAGRPQRPNEGNVYERAEGAKPAAKSAAKPVSKPRPAAGSAAAAAAQAQDVRTAAAKGNNEIICGRNSVVEAIKSGCSVNKVWLAENTNAAFAASVFKLCKEAGIPCHQLPRHKLESLAGPEHHGIAAEVAPLQYSYLEDVLALAEERGEDPFVIVLDGVEDPHNLGAVIRTALCAGAHGVVIGKRRSAALNQTVLSTSAGAAYNIPIVRVANLNQAIRDLKAAGCWAVAADMDGTSLWKSNLTGGIALVLGAEGSGVSPLIKRNCDHVVSIPMRGNIGSLNISNAAAIMMYEIVRQRRGM